MAQIIYRDKNNDEPLSVIMVIKGREETQDTLDVLDKLQEKWDNE